MLAERALQTPLFQLRTIDADHLTDPEALHRFAREIRALRTVEHPNIVCLREDNLDEERKFPAFVMDLAETSLTAYAAERNDGTRPVLPPSEAISVLRAMTKALTVLHGGHPKIVHRDLNPNNILRMPDGRWVLADFGLAKFIGPGPMSTTFATRTRIAMGTAYYAAPEQYVDLKSSDERTDVYALGVLLWELMSKCGPPPERDASGLDEPLNTVYRRATERAPDARFRSVEEYDEAFERALVVPVTAA